MSEQKYAIAAFYSFVALTDLEDLQGQLLDAMRENDVLGTVILAPEGFNSSVSARLSNLRRFLAAVRQILKSDFDPTISFHDEPVFKRAKVKVKKEIVTLRKSVDVDLGEGTHVDADEWDALIDDPGTVVIDARNDYEFKIGTFEGAINPAVESFGELPKYFEENFDASEAPPVAMFCTGGIRCEKLAPFLVEQGFRRVYQLQGGILKYLEARQGSPNKWQGECFVFDERISVDRELKKGSSEDVSVDKSLSRAPDPE